MAAPPTPRRILSVAPLRQAWPTRVQVLDLGGGAHGIRARWEFGAESQLETYDLATGWDALKDAWPKRPHQVIFLNHVLEHVDDPDRLLDLAWAHCYQYESLLVLGTPNLAAWMNRLQLLAGYVPSPLELSRTHQVGKWGPLQETPLGGHRYVYTLPALLQLMKLHGFKIRQVVGEASTALPPWVRGIDRWIARTHPTLASAVRVLATAQ